MSATQSSATAIRTAPSNGNRAAVARDEMPSDYLDRHTARELMTPGVVVLSEDASLRQAFNAMTIHGVHAILIVARDRGTPIGWVTGRGLLSRLDEDPSLSRVGDAVTERPVSVAPSASARDAIRRLTESGVSHLLVSAEDGVMPEGVLSEIDLVWLAGELPGGHRQA